MIDVLIVNDNRFREQFSTELLAGYLKKDLVVKIISKTIFRTAIQTLKPQAVIVPRVQTDFHDIFDYKEKYKFKLFFIPVEHSGGNESGIKSFMKDFIQKDNLDKSHSEKLKQNISKIFVPGKFYKNILLKNNLFTENQIIITGTPNSDLWFKDINLLFKKKKNINKTIGIATSFKSSMFGSDFKSIQHSISIISGYKKNLISHNNKNYLVDIKSLEKDIFFIWYEMFQFMIIHKIITDNKNINFSIRSHPMENIKNVQYYMSVTKNLSLDRNLVLNEWISNQKMILSFGSTLLYDSYFSGIKSYNLRRFVPNNILDLVDDFLKPAYSEFPFQPENFDELYKIINSNQIQEDDYFTKEIENKIQETSIPLFNYPRKDKSYKIIGDEIKNNLKIIPKTFFSKIKINYFIFLIFLKQIKLSNFSFKYKYVSLDKLYNPLDILNNYKLKKYIKKILAK